MGRLWRVCEGVGPPVVDVGRVRARPDRAPGVGGDTRSSQRIVHELTQVAAWYAEQDIDIDRSLLPIEVES